MNDLSDGQLVAEAKAGNLEAFARLVERHQEKIYQAVRRFTRNHEDADDLTQETWMCAFRSLNNFREEASFSTWIFRIAMNLTLNFLKKQKREKGRKDWVESMDQTGNHIGSNLSPPIRSELHELEEKLQAAVASLPFPYRSAFILVAFEGLSHRQAAEILGCSENTVAWRIHKARRMLQKKLQPYMLR